MKDVFLCLVAFAVTLSIGAKLSQLDQSQPAPWLLENFEKLDLSMCRNYHGLDAINPGSDKSDRYAGECGFMQIPNLRAPKPLAKM